MRYMAAVKTLIADAKPPNVQVLKPIDVGPGL
jgi:hypothetical protein